VLPGFGRRLRLRTGRRSG